MRSSSGGEELGLGELVVGPVEQRGDRPPARPAPSARPDSRATLAASTSSASRVRGTGSRCPASRPPARTNAMCSLTSGASSASAQAARWVTRAGSSGSAPPSDSRMPCGITGTPRSRRSTTPRGGPAGATDSAMTSQNPRPGTAATQPAISGRQPAPTPSTTNGRPGASVPLTDATGPPPGAGRPSIPPVDAARSARAGGAPHAAVHAGTPLRRHRASRDAGPPTDAAVLPRPRPVRRCVGRPRQPPHPPPPPQPPPPQLLPPPHDEPPESPRPTSSTRRRRRPRSSAARRARPRSPGPTPTPPTSRRGRSPARPPPARTAPSRGVPWARGCGCSSRRAASVRSPRRVRRGAEASRIDRHDRHDDERHDQPARPAGVRDAREQPHQPQPGHGDHPPAGAADPAPLGVGEQQARVDQPPLGRRERVGDPVVLFAIHLRCVGVATAAWTARSSSSCPASRARDGLRVAALRPDRAAQPQRGERGDQRQLGAAVEVGDVVRTGADRRDRLRAARPRDRASGPDRRDQHDHREHDVEEQEGGAADAPGVAHPSHLRLRQVTSCPRRCDGGNVLHTDLRFRLHLALDAGEHGRRCRAAAAG